ncbi:hypothetical protein M0805_004325 [Coniferiporia weirii]|nr:hypothetical protein M0805_004325 [Coniferiporia weirii]
MRPRHARLVPFLTFAALLATFAAAPIHAAPNALAAPSLDSPAAFPANIYAASADNDHILVARDGHEHMHGHGAPLLEVNETEVLRWHKPTPPSYATHDFEDPDVAHKYPYLMGLHALCMGLAFFGALPVGIALRSVNHGLHGVSVAAFYVFIVLGLACSALYRKLTPNMYEGAKHGPQGYLVILLALALTTVDALATLTRAARFVLAVRRGEMVFSIKAFWRTVVLNKEGDAMPIGPKAYAHEYTGLVVEEPEEMDVPELKAAGDVDHVDMGGEHEDSGLQSPISEEDSTERWANDMRSMHREHRSRRSEWRHSVASERTLFNANPGRRGSHHSDETLHELPAHVQSAKLPLLQRVGLGAFATTERVLVFLGYMQMLTGIVTYTGVCRDSYVNACLAHLIKGGIFWCYGLVSFARFLGSFSELGWAWNRSPRLDKAPSAEFVESFVIFLYGITNTWMERFGVEPGSPYTTKQVQHISIAVMFWFAGLVGMGIESSTIRSWLAAPASALAVSSSSSTAKPTAPASYRASFNPFPALVIGVTGLAMSAHAQAYLFQVQVHVLWGQLLAGFSLLRCLTYFFVWLSPPTSVLPSRPPTEALASFFLACGGLVFQFSLEELDLAAIRRGHDDVMMFLNVAVAMTCLAFCWVLGIVTFKAWLKTRQVASVASQGIPASA